MATYSPPNSPGSLWGQKKPEELFSNPSLNQRPKSVGFMDSYKGPSAQPSPATPQQGFWAGYNPAAQTGQPAPTFGSSGDSGELPAWMQKAANSFEEERKAQTRALNMSTAVEGAKAGIASPANLSIYGGTPTQAQQFANQQSQVIGAALDRRGQKVNQATAMPTNYYR